MEPNLVFHQSLSGYLRGGIETADMMVNEIRSPGVGDRRCHAARVEALRFRLMINVVCIGACEAQCFAVLTMALVAPRPNI